MTRTDDPLNCQTKPQLSYLAWHEDADRRMKAGEKQTRCKTCQRYRWDDERCEKFAS